MVAVGVYLLGDLLSNVFIAVINQYVILMVLFCLFVCFFFPLQWDGNKTEI
jgi:hypothetical protein